MASGHGLTFIQDLIINSASTGLYDAQGNALATADILGSGNTAYSKPFLRSKNQQILYFLLLVKDVS